MENPKIEKELLVNCISEITEMNSKLSTIANILLSLTEEVKELKGHGLYNSMSEIYEKLDELNQTAESIKGPKGYDLTDIFTELSEVNTNTYK